jgi:hypothetical protein
VPTAHPLDIRITRLLAQAVKQSGQRWPKWRGSRGLKRDTVRCSLSGDRNASLVDAVAILDAAGLPGEQAVFLMLIASDDFALARAGSTLAEFLESLFRRAPKRDLQSTWPERE